jgi:hypothetical protein
MLLEALEHWRQLELSNNRRVDGEMLFQPLKIQIQKSNDKITYSTGQQISREIIIFI